MMTIPDRVHRIASDVSATVSKDERAILGSYLSTVETNEELFRRCLDKAQKKLQRFNESDALWLKRWLPIILKTIQEQE